MVLVRARPEVVMPNGLRDRVVGVPIREIHVGADEVNRAVPCEVLLNVVVITSVRHRVAPLVPLLVFTQALGVDELVEVALVEPMAL